MPDVLLGTVVGPPGPQGPKGDDGTFNPEDLQRITNLETGKVDKVSGKGLSTNDYTDADKNSVATIGNKVDKVSGKGLSTNDYTDADKNAVATIGNKVDKVSGKGLSTNDYTTAEKNKLSGIETGANKTVIDNTLSNAGQAADAKATGDAIAFLREYLKSMDVSRTASGNPATFSDADAANVKALSVTMTPTRSGSGDPYPPGGGKNQCPVEVESATVNGVTFTVNQSAGTVTVNGTASATTVFYLNDTSNRYTGNNWILNGCPAGGTVSTYCLKMFIHPGNGYGSDTGSSLTFTGIDSLKCGIVVYQGVTLSSAVFRPMIRLASNTDATFAPYSNIRPISGATSVTVTRTGENLWGGSRMLSDIQAAIPSAPVSGDSITYSGSASNGKTFIAGIFRENVRYTLVLDYTTTNTGSLINIQLRYTDGTTQRIGSEQHISPLTVVTAENKTLSAIMGDWSGGTTTFNTAGCGIFEGTEAVFETYQGQTVTVSLTDGANPLTVYGGTLNVTTGELTVTHGNIASYNGETVPDGWISSTGQLSTGAQVVYPLANPVTYQLTPTQIATLSGYNAVFSDAERVDVTYKADTSFVWGGG